jgi:hypothetical protein
MGAAGAYAVGPLVAATAGVGPLVALGYAWVGALELAGYAVGALDSGEQGGVAGHNTTGEGARSVHQLSATVTSWSSKVPLQRTLRVTLVSARPHLVGQVAFEVHQNGAQGAVAQHTKSAFGFWLILQNVSATISPSG